MALGIERHLARLAQVEPAARRAALEEVLCAERLAFERQTREPGQGSPRQVQNYLLLPRETSPCPLFCAHYDAHPGSPGANDNAAAVCILIDLAQALRERGVPAAFAFLDGEEEKHLGAKLFEAERTRDFSVVVNLDVCGYGDTLTVYTKGGEKKPAAAPFWDKKRLAAHNGQRVKFLPESDDRCFSTKDQPVFSVAVMPRWDVGYLGALAGMGSGLLGRPPEFELILGQMEVVSTMHGAFRDGVQWVQPAAMEQVYGYLLDAACAPPVEKKPFGLFSS